MRNRSLLDLAAVPFALAIGALACDGEREQEASGVAVRPAVIAVAPFRVMGVGLEPWSGLGLAEQIRRALDTMPGIAVHVADSKSPGLANYTLGGTVSRGDARSEIGVELTRVRDRSVVWTGTFWRSPADLPSFSAELADAVIQAVRLDEKRAILARDSP